MSIKFLWKGRKLKVELETYISDFEFDLTETAAEGIKGDLKQKIEERLVESVADDLYYAHGEQLEAALAEHLSSEEVIANGVKGAIAKRIAHYLEHRRY